MGLLTYSTGSSSDGGDLCPNRTYVLGNVTNTIDDIQLKACSIP
jgi:hypothetical protein